MAGVSLEPEIILSAYAAGAFPMADHAGEIHWYTADPRGILPLETFHVPQSLRGLINRPPEQGGFEIRVNHDFRAVMEACGECRDGGTWINQKLVNAYVRLHELGFAHSVECWRDGELAGGLYGVSLGGAFFGESMFHRQSHASKVALVHLVRRLIDRGFVLLDAQNTTSHLRRFGCIEVSAQDYLRMLRDAVSKTCRFA